MTKREDFYANDLFDNRDSQKSNKKCQCRLFEGLFANNKKYEKGFFGTKDNFKISNVDIASVKNSNLCSELLSTLVHLKWRYVIFTVILGTLGSWLLFGCIYYSIALMEKNNAKCIANVDNFASAFAYALEVQVTI
ncbi:MAG: Inward rectifier potassium channel 2, partial [Paramarteilia canceri]